MNTKKSKNNIESYIGKILRVGVIVSAIFMLIGFLIWIYFPQNATDITDITFNNICFSLINFNPYGFMYLGIFLLILTPIIRVTTTIILFATQKDKLFMSITILVLIILITSFFISYLK